MKMYSNQRISIRTNERNKRLLEAAAILSGHNSLSSFVLAIAYKEADRIIKESESQVLSDPDRDLVLDLLENPPEPNKNLKQILFNSKNIEIKD